MKNAGYWDVAQCWGLIRPDGLEEQIASIFRVERISKQGTMLKNCVFWDVKTPFFIVTAVKTSNLTRNDVRSTANVLNSAILLP
jgi:hypothetical protein